MRARARRGSTSVRLPDGELRWRFTRSGGPGGQHANTSDTRVSLSVDLATLSTLSDVERERAFVRLTGGDGRANRLVDGRLTVTADEHRSQARNREVARERLRALIAEAIAPGPRARRATRPSRAARERRLRDKRRRSDLKRSRGQRDDD